MLDEGAQVELGRGEPERVPVDQEAGPPPVSSWLPSCGSPCAATQGRPRADVAEVVVARRSSARCRRAARGRRRGRRRRTGPGPHSCRVRPGRGLREVGADLGSPASGDPEAVRARAGGGGRPSSTTTSRGGSEVPSRHGVAAEGTAGERHGQRARVAVASGASTNSSPPSRSATAPAYAASRSAAAVRGPRLVVGDEEPRLGAGVRRPVVRAEADRQVARRRSTSRVPGRRTLGEDVGVVDAGRRLKHGRPAWPGAGRRRARSAGCGSARGGRRSARRDRRSCPRSGRSRRAAKTRRCWCSAVPGSRSPRCLLAPSQLLRRAGDVDQQHVEAGGQSEQVVEAPRLVEHVVGEHVACRTTRRRRGRGGTPRVCGGRRRATAGRSRSASGRVRIWWNRSTGSTSHGVAQPTRRLPGRASSCRRSTAR